MGKSIFDKKENVVGRVPYVAVMTSLVTGICPLLSMFTELRAQCVRQCINLRASAGRSCYI